MKLEPRAQFGPETDWVQLGSVHDQAPCRDRNTEADGRAARVGNESFASRLGISPQAARCTRPR